MNISCPDASIKNSNRERSRAFILQQREHLESRKAYMYIICILDKEVM